MLLCALAMFAFHFGVWPWWHDICNFSVLHKTLLVCKACFVCLEGVLVSMVAVFFWVVGWGSCFLVFFVPYFCAKNQKSGGFLRFCGGFSLKSGVCCVIIGLFQGNCYEIM